MSGEEYCRPNINTPKTFVHSLTDRVCSPVFLSISGFTGQPEQSPSIIIFLSFSVFLMIEYLLFPKSKSNVNDQSLSSAFLRVSPLFPPRQKWIISIKVYFPRPFLESFFVDSLVRSARMTLKPAWNSIFLKEGLSHLTE